MRTIVPFVLAIAIAGALSAQPGGPPPTDFLEKKIADGRGTMQDRITLMNLYLGARNVEKRREQVLWLAEHNPEIPNFRNPPFHLGFSGPLPDPAGFDQAAAIWRTTAAKPYASTKAIANAAWFFRFGDRALAWWILNKAMADHPGDEEIAKMRGTLDVIEMGALVEQQNRMESNAIARQLPAAKKAREEVDSSRDAKLLGAAADFLSQQFFLFNTSFQSIPAMGNDDALDLAERWLARAREIEPENKEYRAILGRIYTSEAQQAADPKWKVELLRKADALIDNWFGLPQLAMAEFEAGNDEAALKVAQRMLERKPQPPNFANSAHTIRGLVALEQSRVADAKAELLESAKINGVFEPERTLAQALMDAGERDIVIQFFETSRSFWKNDQGAIDHYIRMVKAPGTHDITTRFFPGQDVRGRPAPKLPIDDYAGKAVAVQFRNAACKECAKEFEALNKAVASRGVVDTWIDFQGNESLVNQYQIETFPTVVLIDTQGRVADFIPGHLDERVLDQRLEQLALRGPRQLPAPKSIAGGPPGVLTWSPVAGAESYVVQWDQRDDKGWLSDRDDHLVRVIPTHESSVTLDPALGETNPGTIRWRVFAVSRTGAGSMSEWREMSVVRP